MSRTVCAVVLFSVLAAPGRAQQAGTRPDIVIRLCVTPAAAPEPALKYLLLPDLQEMNPGNPIQGYMKCFLEQYRFVFDEQEFDKREILLTMPLDDLSVQEPPGFSRLILAQADAAARLDNPDWQILLKLRADGFETLLPDVQAMRTVARALQARFRAEVAAGRIDDAIRTAKTMFAMSRHLGEHPTLIGELVGIAIAATAIEPLEEMLQQPNCPNLYWALTNLPAPFISCKAALEGERLTLWGFTRDLDSAAPMGPDAIKKFIDRLDKLIGENSPNIANGGVRGYLSARTKDEKKLAAARERLVKSGLSSDRLKAFQGDQVILLDEARELLARFDEIAKIMVFPPWQFEALTEKAGVAKREQTLLADALLPAQSAVHQAHGRMAQRIALLRHVEAVRMYAAEHKGALPAKLSDLTVPLPDEPFTGKPFRYELDGLDGARSGHGAQVCARQPLPSRSLRDHIEEMKMRYSPARLLVALVAAIACYSSVPGPAANRAGGDFDSSVRDPRGGTEAGPQVFALA